jgi:hypothetical protein
MSEGLLGLILLVYPPSWSGCCLAPKSPARDIAVIGLVVACWPHSYLVRAFYGMSTYSTLADAVARLRRLNGDATRPQRCKREEKESGRSGRSGQRRRKPNHVWIELAEMRKSVHSGFARMSLSRARCDPFQS